MKLIGLLIARNEAWSLPAHLMAASAYLDGLVVLCHACTEDTTEKIVYEHRDKFPVSVLTESNPGWYEATYRTRLLTAGRRVMGGTHFTILDADEMLTAGVAKEIRTITLSLNPGQCLRLPWLHCWRSLDCYRTDASPFGRATAPAVFCDSHRLSYSPDADGYELHTRTPRGAQAIEENVAGGIIHLQHANWRRLLAKQLLYEMNEVLQFGKVRGNYIGTCYENGLQTTPIPAEWWPIDKSTIDMAAEPWQIAECRRLIGIYGTDRFHQCKVLPLAGAAGLFN